VSEPNVNLALAVVLANIISGSRGDGWPLITTIGAFAGMYSFYRGFTLLGRKRLIENTPTSKIRSASMGLVEVSGLAVGPNTMVAPLTKRDCFYYHTIAWKLKQSGKNSEWEKIAEENRHLPFFLDDNTGKVLVDATGAEMDIHRDFHEEYCASFLSSTAELPPAVDGFLMRHGVSSGKKIKVEEYCIKPKNALFVLGTLAENPGSCVTPAVPQSSALAPTFPRNVSPEIIRLSTQNAQPNPAAMSQQEKVASALMRAGITNPAAWAVAGVESSHFGSVASGTASGAAVGVALEKEVFDSHPPVVLMKGEHNPAFFISWRSQREVVKSLGWKSVLMIWGGPALTILSLYGLLDHYKLL
jgi:E3 ubiquitin ligase